MIKQIIPKNEKSAEFVRKYGNVFWVSKTAAGAMAVNVNGVAFNLERPDKINGEVVKW